MIAMVAVLSESGRFSELGLVSGFCCGCGMWGQHDAHVRVCVWVRDPARNEVVQTPVICNNFTTFSKTGDNLEYRQNGFVRTEKVVLLATYSASATFLVLGKQGFLMISLSIW